MMWDSVFCEASLPADEENREKTWECLHQKHASYSINIATNSCKHIGGRLFASGPRSSSLRLRIPLGEVSVLICIGGGGFCIICLFADAAYVGGFDFFQFGNNAEGREPGAMGASGPSANQVSRSVR